MRHLTLLLNLCVFAVSTVLWLAGCDLPDQRKKPSDIAVPVFTPPSKVGRFAVLEGSSKFALDTQTGLTCKTWDWKGAPSDPYFPTCVELYTNEKDTVEYAKWGPRTNAKVDAETDSVLKLLNQTGQAQSAKAATPSVRVGQQVKLKDGRTIIVKHVYPDGSFD